MELEHARFNASAQLSPLMAPVIARGRVASSAPMAMRSWAAARGVLAVSALPFRGEHEQERTWRATDGRSGSGGASAEVQSRVHWCGGEGRVLTAVLC